MVTSEGITVDTVTVDSIGSVATGIEGRALPVRMMALTATAYKALCWRIVRSTRNKLSRWFTRVKEKDTEDATAKIEVCAERSLHLSTVGSWVVLADVFASRLQLREQPPAGRLDSRASRNHSGLGGSGLEFARLRIPVRFY